MNLFLTPKPTTPKPWPGLTLWMAGAVLLLAACASGPPPPTAQMAVAAAAIDQAVSAGAAELAPAELGAAREKLDRARVAMSAHDHSQALMLSEQAQADAQLAVTRTRAAKAEKAAAALQEDHRILREEIRRNQR
ncbi:hypothetical protein GCM10027399_08110 [Curvibacter fontanus]|jgi:hypothetical protein